MKKLILIIISGIMILTSCQKEQVVKGKIAETHPSTATALPPKPGNQQIERNYCEGCGQSPTFLLTCIFSHWDLDDGHMVLYCGTGGSDGHGDCVTDILNDSAVAHQYNDLLDMEQGYKVRDSLLIYYLKGQQYITYYYYISAVVEQHNTINISNLMQHLSFAHDVFTVAHTLMYGEDNDIVFTDVFKNEALNLISFYRTFESALVFQNALNNIQSDLNNYVNMTRAQIFASLNP